MVDARDFIGHWEEGSHVVNGRPAAGMPGSVLSLESGGSFGARLTPGTLGSWTFTRTRLTVSEWYGEWRVYEDDVYGPWIRLVPTSINSPGQRLLSSIDSAHPITSIIGMLDNNRRTKNTLLRLSREANIVTVDGTEIHLSWRGHDGSQVTCIWRRLP